jgi:hypothetical protein
VRQRIAACLVVMSVNVLAWTGCAQEKLDHTRFDVIAAVAAWVEAWNTRDLDQVDRLFVQDSTLTYFSSERDGLIRGIDAVRQHHVNMGFELGGAPADLELWLEDIEYRPLRPGYVVTATWKFGNRIGPQDSVQVGPMTAVYVRVEEDGYRIGHMHFSEYSREDN